MEILLVNHVFIIEEIFSFWLQLIYININVFNLLFILKCINLLSILILLSNFDSLPISLHRLFGEYPESDWLPWIAYSLAFVLSAWALFVAYDTYQDSKDEEKLRKRRRKNERYTKYRIMGTPYEVIDEFGNRTQYEIPPGIREDSDRPGW